MNRRALLSQKLGEYRLAVARYAEECEAMEKAEAVATAAKQAQECLQAVAQAVQQTAHQRVAGFVTRCLRAVFGRGAYGFEIDFDRKRGKTEARLLFVRNDKHLTSNEVGGGVVDVASLGLRVASLLLSRPRLRPLLVLDEPLRFLSYQYRARARLMLETLASDFGIQIVQVTHSKQLVTGKVVELGRPDE